MSRSEFLWDGSLLIKLIKFDSSYMFTKDFLHETDACGGAFSPCYSILSRAKCSDYRRGLD
jgi:hypothetical protein